MLNGKYTLKAIKIFTGREGNGFNVNLYKGTKKVAFIYDDASGGEVSYEWVDHAEDRVNVEIRPWSNADENDRGTLRTTPEEGEFLLAVLAADLEDDREFGTVAAGDCLISEQVFKQDYERELRAQLRRETVFRLKSLDEVRTLKVKFEPKQRQRIVEYLERKYPNDWVILNELHVADAVRLMV